MTNEDQVPSREMQLFVEQTSANIISFFKTEFSGAPSQSPSAQKIKINVGISFKPLTITVSVEF